MLTHNTITGTVWYFSSDLEDLVETRSSIAAQMVTVEQQKRQEQNVRELRRRYVSFVFVFCFRLIIFTITKR